MQQTILVTVRVNPETATRLEKLAASMERSKSYVAAEAIEEYLDLHEWHVEAIKEGINAADHGETVSFDEVKKYWKQKVENPSH